MKNRRKIERQQREMFGESGPLFTRLNKIHLPQTSFFKEILNFDEEVIDFALGESGLRLRAFAETIDLLHPESIQVIDQDSSHQILGLLEIARFAKQNGYEESFAPKRFPNLRLDSPLKNQVYVRLLPSRKDRDWVRSTKSVRKIDLLSVFKKGQVAWDALPNNFSMYIRSSEEYKKELDKARKKMDRFTSLGCLDLAFEIEKTVERFRLALEENYFGFHRLSLLDAAVILAKLHGFEFKEDHIEIPRNFTDTSFDPSDERRLWFVYRPRAYPAGELKLPRRVKRIIDYLEEFEDADGRAIFDHFVVIVPSLMWPSGGELVVDGEGIVFESEDELAKVLDKILIKQKAVTPILLGERDGRCYFICYWL